MAPKKKPAGSPPSPDGGTLDEWRRRAVIRGVVLPSGMVVDIRAVPLDELAAVDGLPTALQRVALLHASGAFEKTLADIVQTDGGQESAEALLEDNRALLHRVIRLAIAGPPALVQALADLDDDDPLDGIDGFDKEMVAGIAQRQIVTDATGRRVYGAQPVTSFPDAGREP